MGPANWHFIIVDDDMNIRSRLRGVIERHYPASGIFEAANGHEALKLYDSHGADLMIVDHQIPLLDGLSLVRFLRARGATIPVVVTSHNPEVEKLSAAAGATYFVEKRQLLESLDMLLPGWLVGERHVQK